MTLSKANQRLVERQPFAMTALEDWCGTKTLAKRFAISLGDALDESDKARNRGDSGDGTFELMFHDGTLFITEDELFEMGVHADSLIDFTAHIGYDEELDATFHLCGIGPSRKFIVVRYEFKEDEYALTAWWQKRVPVRQGC